MRWNGAKPRLGRPPGPVPLAERRRRFDATRWPGACRELKRDARTKSESQLRTKYRFKTRQGVSWALQSLGIRKGWIQYLGRPDIRRDRVLQLRKQGLSWEAIAFRLNANEKTVRRRLNGVPVPGVRWAYKRRDITAKSIRPLAARGLNPNAIAQKLRTSRPTVVRRAKVAGIELQRYGRHERTLRLHARIKRFTARGLIRNQIARRVGRDWNTVNYHDRRYRLRIPRKPRGRKSPHLRRST